MTAARRPTINAVAAKAGVSRGTVGMILSGKGELFRSETIALVREAAEAIGYRPNAAAQSTRTGRTGAIGLLRSQHSLASVLSPRLLEGIEGAIDDQQLRLSLARFPDSALTAEAFIPELLRTVSVDGLLIHYTSSIPERMRSLIQAHQIPAVWMNIHAECDAVRPDDLSAGERAAEILIAQGHRNIAFVDYTVSAMPTSDQWHYSFRDRPTGVAKRCAKKQVRYRYIGASEGDWMVTTRTWLGGRNRPSAVVVNGSPYVNVILHVAALLGLKIPGDLSLIMINGNRDQLLGRWPHLLLTPDIEVGRTAVAMLLKRIAGKRAQPAVALPFTEIPGDTVGAPRG